MSKTTRLLSLILVIAMAFSLFAVSGSAKWADDAADLSDYATVKYQEAAKVLTYINVIDGIDGAFKPEGNLQRDAAAKIISRLMTGVKSDDLVQTSTSFSDVPKSQWASGYIQWCANNNIVNGFGDGTFKPTNSVTVYQFLKMLLTGLGYGAQNEFVGAGWEIEVQSRAVQLGLFGSVEPPIVDRVATREEAMEFALNTLVQFPVVFGTTYDYRTYDGAYISKNTSGTKAELYNIHGLALEESGDALGYLTYQWLDASNDYVIWEAKTGWYRQIAIDHKTKAADLTKGLKNASGTWGFAPDIFVNGADVSYSFANIADFTAWINGTGAYQSGGVDTPQLPFLYGAKLTIYTYADKSIKRIVIEFEIIGIVSDIDETKGTYNASTYQLDSASTVAGVTYKNIVNTEKFEKDELINIVPIFSSFSWGADPVLDTEYYAISKSIKAGTFSRWYWYTQANGLAYKDRIFTLGGKDTVIGVVTGYEETEIGAVGFAVGIAPLGDSANYGTENLWLYLNDLSRVTYTIPFVGVFATPYANTGETFYLSSTGAIIYAEIAPAATRSPVKYGLLKKEDTKYDLEYASYIYTAYGSYKVFNSAGKSENVSSIIVGGDPTWASAAGPLTVPTSANVPLFLAYYDKPLAAGFATLPAGWYIAQAATGESTWDIRQDGWVLEGGTTGNLYDISADAVVYDSVNDKFLTRRSEIAALGLGLSDGTTTGDIQVYLAPNGIDVIGIILY